MDKGAITTVQIDWTLAINWIRSGELQPISGSDPLASLGHPSKFQQVSRVGSVTARHSKSGRQPNCGVEQTVPPVVGRATITLGIGPHSSVYIMYQLTTLVQ